MIEDDETRERDSGLGYPEEGQPGTGIDPREHPEENAVPDDDAPPTSTRQDGDAGQATGNPHAAGADADADADAS